MNTPSVYMELPPRARRIRILDEYTIGLHGTTSACAENTGITLHRRSRYRNYLRVRGEYAVFFDRLREFEELPPRARRIRNIADQRPIKTGTTSACAENTSAQTAVFPAAWNYLRVRGEYYLDLIMGTSFAELPPRARRIQPLDPGPVDIGGTTSACAENTDQFGLRVVASGNYLRVRGEYHGWGVICWATWELPPRARRIQ